MEQTAAQAASEAIPEAETFTEPWEEPGETMAKPGKTKNAPAEPEKRRKIEIVRTNVEKILEPEQIRTGRSALSL